MACARIEGNDSKALTFLKMHPNMDVDYPGSPLEAAIDHGHLNVVSTLLSQIPNINKMCHFEGQYGTPLLHALTMSRIAIAGLLIDAGADVTHRAPFKKSPTALHLACMTDAVKSGTLIAQLLKKGARIHVSAPVLYYGKPETCLAISLTNDCSLDVFRLLLDSGADPMSTDQHGYPAIWLAFCKGKIYHAHLLFERGASPFYHHLGVPLEDTLLNFDEICRREFSQLLRKWRARWIATHTLPVFLFCEQEDEGQFAAFRDPFITHTCPFLVALLMNANRLQSLS